MGVTVVGDLSEVKSGRRFGVGLGVWFSFVFSSFVIHWFYIPDIGYSLSSAHHWPFSPIIPPLLSPPLIPTPLIPTHHPSRQSTVSNAQYTFGVDEANTPPRNTVLYDILGTFYNICSNLGKKATECDLKGEGKG